jgi:hypothetical protein
MQRLFFNQKSIGSFLFAPVIFLVSFVLVSCGAVNSENKATDANQVLPNETNSAPAPSDPTPKINTDWEQYLSSNVVEYSVSTKECDYSDGSLEIQVEFKNLTDKNIIAFEASATIFDIFSVEIGGYNISSDKGVGPQEAITTGSAGNTCYEINSYSDSKRLLEMEDINKTSKLVIQVTKIAFEDGEIKEF